MDWLQRLLDILREWLRRRRLADRPAYEWQTSDLSTLRMDKDNPTLPEVETISYAEYFPPDTIFTSVPDNLYHPTIFESRADWMARQVRILEDKGLA